MARSLTQCLYCRWVLAFLLFGGCGRSPHQATLDRLYPDRQTVSKVAGFVAVDGEPAQTVFLRLVPVADAKPQPNNPQTFTDQNGAFAFSTYLEGDGVPHGEYHLLIEKLQPLGEDIWGGPDAFKNLFNHLSQPVQTLDVTQDLPRLKINLQVEGKSPQREPPYGVSQLGDRRGGRR